MLEERARAGKPVRVGLIGAGKFGTMFLAQARRTPGLHVMAVADLEPARADAALARAGWEEDERRVRSFAQAMQSGGTHVCDDAFALIGADGLDVSSSTRPGTRPPASPMRAPASPPDAMW